MSTNSASIKLLRRNNIPALLVAATNIAVAMTVLFTTQLHQEFSFARLLLAVALGALGLVRLATISLNDGTQKKLQLTIVVLDLLTALIINFASTAADLAQTLTLWAALTCVVKLVNLFLWGSGESKYACLAPLGLAICFLLTGTDLVALTGWFGAYTVILGIFGMIAAFDNPAKTAEKNGTAS